MKKITPFVIRFRKGTADVQQNISKLTPNQARYHFISGYTAKVAGSEEGVKETVLTDTLSGGYAESSCRQLEPTWRIASMLATVTSEIWRCTV